MTALRVLGRAAALATVIATGCAAGAHADAGDYEFRLVSPEVKKGEGVVVAVRLVHKSSGRAVPDAVIYSTRVDMSPDNMAAMVEPAEPLPSTEPGVYRFRTNFTMTGNWAFSLAAKVQGETGTVRNKLIVKAVR